MKENMKGKLALGGSLFSAFVASLCCLGPLVAVALGLGGFGAAAFFEVWRPYLLGVTFLLLGAGFYFTYRKRGTVCENGTCRVPGAGRWNKTALWVVTVLVVGFAAFPYYSSIFLTGSRASTNSLPQPQAVTTAPHYNLQSATTNLSMVTLKVAGMTCAGCAVNVETALKKQDGVQSVEVSLEQKQATVKYDSTKINPAQLVEAVNKIGYRTSL